jgi:FkbM family methyltransferase
LYLPAGIFLQIVALLNQIKRLLPHAFRQRLKRSLFAHVDMISRLKNLRAAGFANTGAIDGGAFCGDWSKEFWSVWPDSPCCMIEPLPSQQTNLLHLSKRVAKSFVVAKALGKVSGSVQFQMGETNSHIVASEIHNADVLTIECTTLDQILTDVRPFHPNLLKLDLQGHELSALEGCPLHLLQFEVIIVEVSILRIGDVPIFSDVDQFMKVRGYRLYDVLPQYYRPRDKALWQMDVFYVRENSALIASRSWD